MPSWFCVISVLCQVDSVLFQCYAKLIPCYFGVTQKWKLHNIFPPPPSLPPSKCTICLRCWGNFSVYYIPDKMSLQDRNDNIRWAKLRQVALGWKNLHNSWSAKCVMKVRRNNYWNCQILGTLENMARNFNLWVTEHIAWLVTVMGAILWIFNRIQHSVKREEAWCDV